MKKLAAKQEAYLFKGWQNVSDINKTTAQRRLIKISRSTNPLDPDYQFTRKDGQKFILRSQQNENQRSNYSSEDIRLMEKAQVQENSIMKSFIKNRDRISLGMSHNIDPDQNNVPI